jgi:phage terminase Nu1 subunit (DNA packaging protein)
MKWNLHTAAREFGVSRETIKKRLTVAEIEKKATYTTREIVRAIFGDIDSEKLRLCREQADKLELENAESRKTMVPVGDLVPLLGKFLSAARARLDGDPKLEREEKDKIIEDLGKCLDVACGFAPGTAPAADTAASVHG